MKDIEESILLNRLLMDMIKAFMHHFDAEAKMTRNEYIDIMETHIQKMPASLFLQFIREDKKP